MKVSLTLCCFFTSLCQSHSVRLLWSIYQVFISWMRSVLLNCLRRVNKYFQQIKSEPVCDFTNLAEFWLSIMWKNKIQQLLVNYWSLIPCKCVTNSANMTLPQHAVLVSCTGDTGWSSGTHIEYYLLLGLRALLNYGEIALILGHFKFRFSKFQIFRVSLSNSTVSQN